MRKMAITTEFSGRYEIRNGVMALQEGDLVKKCLF